MMEATDQMTLRHLLFSSILLMRTALAFQEVPETALEQKVRAQLVSDGADDGRTLEKRLLALGDPAAVASLVLRVAEASRKSKPGERGYRELLQATTALGLLRVKAGMGLLSELARAGDTDVRLAAVQAIGEIDPEASRDVLLQQLGEGYYPIRQAAAVGLSRVNDPAVAAALEAQASREPSRGASLEMLGLAQVVRARLQTR